MSQRPKFIFLPSGCFHTICQIYYSSAIALTCHFNHLLNVYFCFQISNSYQIYFWHQAPEFFFLTWFIEWQLILSAKKMCCLLDKDIILDTNSVPFSTNLEYLKKKCKLLSQFGSSFLEDTSQAQNRDGRVFLLVPLF